MSKNLAVMLIVLLFVSSVILTTSSSSGTVEANSWTTKAPMHQARNGLEVIAVDGKIYAIGGSTSTGTLTGATEMYDPNKDVWVNKASMPTPRRNFVIAAYQDKIYCIGGQIGSQVTDVDERTGFTTTIPIMSNATEVYDTVTDTWTTKAAMPYSATYIAAQKINDKIYIVNLSHLFVYDLISDSWTINSQLLILPYSASPPTSAVINDSIVITGEYSNFVGRQRLYIYDPQNGTLSQGEAGPILLNNCAAAATTGSKAPQRVYVFGLTSSCPTNSVNQVYDPKTNNWTIATAMPTRRVDFGVAVLNETVYAIGGVIITYSYDATGKYIVGSGGTVTNVNEQYIPVGYGTPDPTYVLEHTPPKISFFSPLNQTYDNSSISILFGVNKNITEVSYSLDGQQKVTIAGNSTIDNIPNGSHNLTIYATDTYGNVGSQTADFTVGKPDILGNTIAVIFIAVTVAIFCLAVGYFLFRRQQKTRNNSPRKSPCE